MRTNGVRRSDCKPPTISVLCPNSKYSVNRSPPANGFRSHSGCRRSVPTRNGEVTTAVITSPFEAELFRAPMPHGDAPTGQACELRAGRRDPVRREAPPWDPREAPPCPLPPCPLPRWLVAASPVRREPRSCEDDPVDWPPPRRCDPSLRRCEPCRRCCPPREPPFDERGARCGAAGAGAGLTNSARGPTRVSTSPDCAFTRVGVTVIAALRSRPARSRR